MTITEAKEKRIKRVGILDWKGGDVGVCGHVQERGGEANSNGREGSEQTTGKKSVASKAAPPRLNFGIYRTKIVV